jgi:probable F420-dependent oxidoreductase
MRLGLMAMAETDPAEIAALARQAEDSGFDYFACGEHLFFHGPTSNAFITLAAAAGATERIGLLSALTILPVYPAVLVAKQAATLDRVSAGRFNLGVGVGGEYPPEFEAAGVEVRDRGARTDETLEIVTRLFAGETLSYQGKFTSVPGLALDPAPTRPPSIWVGGRKPAAMRRAGRFADVWMPYMYTPEKLASSLAQVRAIAEEHHRKSPEGAIFVWGAVDEDGEKARQTAIEVVSRIYQQDFTPLADKYLVAGTPEQVSTRLREFADAGATTAIFGNVTNDITSLADCI